MRTLVLEQPGQMIWHIESEPTPLPDEALVRVRQCGICGTDRHAFNGRQPFLEYPLRLGHELGVEVITAPANAPVRPGDYCAVEPYMFCRSCAACRVGKTNCCKNLRVLGVHADGGHTPLLTVPADKLYASDHLSLESLALVEPLVIGRHSVVRAGLLPGETAVIVGQGPIGLSIALFAQAAGADIAVVDKRRACLQQSQTITGAKGYEPGSALVKQLRAQFGGDLPQIVFDATGSPEAMHASLDLAEQGGRIVFVGHFPGDITIYDPEFHRRELTLLASRNGTGEDFRKVMECLEDGSIDAQRMITHRFAFEEMPQRFAELDTLSGLIKAIITFP